jgi:hypothetical protein
VTRRRVLVVGWFSFDLMGSTAGDEIARDVLCGWLRDAHYYPVVAAHRPTAAHEVSTYGVDPLTYDTVVFVCGPIGNGPPLNEYLDRFAHARRFAVNVTLLQDRNHWNPFDHVIERDSSERVNADITFVGAANRVPVVGVVLVGPQDEYPTNRHDEAEAAFAEVLAEREVVTIRIDTRLDKNDGQFTSAGQVASLIAKMDVVLTTRLHGAALALRAGVPPVVVDSVPGGSKLLAQMRHIGWPLAFDVAGLDNATLSAAFERALGQDGRVLAKSTAKRAAAMVGDVRTELLAALAGDASLGR